MKLLLSVFFLFFLAYGNEKDHQISEGNRLSIPKQDFPFSFAVFGDSRDGDAVLEKIIRSINKDRDILFGINNGDLIPNGGLEDFDRYKKLLTNSKKPILNIIGNHDRTRYGFGGDNNYKKTFGPDTYFSFVYMRSYFIVVDTSDLNAPKGRQLIWLRRELKKSLKYRYRFVFTHVPLYDPRKGAYAKGHSFRNLSDAKKLNTLLDRYRITMLFASHIHAYYRGKWHQTPYIITGGAGAPLKSGGFYHYIKVTVDKDGVKYEVVKI